MEPFSFTYLTGGMVGICEKGRGLILNVSNGFVDVGNGDDEELARIIVDSLNKAHAGLLEAVGYESRRRTVR